MTKPRGSAIKPPGQTKATHGKADALAFLSDGGDMGALMRAGDWPATPLGAASDWPQPLRTVVRLLLNTRHPMFVFWGPTLTCLYNDAYSASLGPERHPGALGRPGREVWTEIWDTIGPQIEQVMSGGGATWHENQLVPITRHGRREDVYWTYSFSPIDQEAAATGVGGVLVVCTETTVQVLAEQRQAERVAARTTERDRLARLFAQAPSFMAMLSGPEHRIELANPAYLRIVGHREVVGRTVADALPDAVDQGYLDLLDGVFRSGEAFSSKGAKYVVQATPGGLVDERFLDFIYQPIQDEDGNVTGIFVEGADVTDRTLAETALRELNDTLEQRVAAEIDARGKTEEALRQAQKMEAVGQLTGGIAHDFNNMLQGVMSGITLAQRRIASGRLEDAPRFLDAALEAGHRAAALTQRLLAFGRRQALDPKSLRPNELIHGIEGLIRQTVGPAITVELHLRDDGWPVCCDPNQLENALLNLAINARDAMLPGGGRLLIETAQAVLDVADTSGWEGAVPGEYVRMTVADTGSGMTPDVLARAFEPFFTTKPDGQGTGLGLSQLYGFVRQSGGVAQLESEAGAGTSVHLYLARCQEAPGDPGQAATGLRQQPIRSVTPGTVLLVEDDVAVRGFAAETLREMGCQVLEAGSGPEGLAALRRALDGPEAGRVDLLVADVGLPGGLNGRQLADAVRELVPTMPILLITGYTGNALVGEDRLGLDMEVLVKPFDLEALAGRVHAMLRRATLPAVAATAMPSPPGSGRPELLPG